MSDGLPPGAVSILEERTDMTTIAVAEQTADELREMMAHEEGYDDVIQRLLSERGDADE